MSPVNFAGRYVMFSGSLTLRFAVRVARAVADGGWAFSDAAAPDADAPPSQPTQSLFSVVLLTEGGEEQVTQLMLGAQQTLADVRALIAEEWEEAERGWLFSFRGLRRERDLAHVCESEHTLAALPHGGFADDETITIVYRTV